MRKESLEKEIDAITNQAIINELIGVIGELTDEPSKEKIANTVRNMRIFMNEQQAKINFFEELANKSPQEIADAKSKYFKFFRTKGFNRFS